MPLTIFGDHTAPLILPSEVGKPTPRTLRIKFLSKKEIRAWQKKREAAFAIVEIESRDAAYDALLGEVVVGWEHIDGAFSVEAISEKYTLPEFTALLDLIPMAMVPGVEDLKK
jgi:hypothetical protein